MVGGGGEEGGGRRPNAVRQPRRALPCSESDGRTIPSSPRGPAKVVDRARGISLRPDSVLGRLKKARPGIRHVRVHCIGRNESVLVVCWEGSWNFCDVVTGPCSLLVGSAIHRFDDTVIRLRTGSKTQDQLLPQSSTDGATGKARRLGARTQHRYGCGDRRGRV